MRLVDASRRALTAALLPFLVPLPSPTAHAGPHEDGMAALDRREVTRASAFFETGAQNGDPRGLYEFAIHATGAEAGSGPPHLEHAAALGEPQAMARLAGIQFRAIPGQGRESHTFPEPPSRVLRLLATACEKQHFDACGTLAQLHAGRMPQTIHLHCPVLNGVCPRSADGAPTCVEGGAPTDEELWRCCRRSSPS